MCIGSQKYANEANDNVPKSQHKVSVLQCQDKKCIGTIMTATLLLLTMHSNYHTANKIGCKINCRLAVKNKLSNFCNSFITCNYVYNTTFTLAYFCGPSFFDSVNSHKTELKWAGPNQASLVQLSTVCSVNIV